MAQIDIDTLEFIKKDGNTYVKYPITKAKNVTGLDAKIGEVAIPKNHASTGTTYGVSNASNYGHAMASSANPVMDGAVAAGTDNGKFAREGHRHPSDTTKVDKTANPVVIGNGATTTSGSDQVSIGLNASTGHWSVAIGRNAECPSYGTGVGPSAKATGSYSVAVGYDSQAAGERSIAIGLGSRAPGLYSTAVGNSAQANANQSSAFGYQAQVPSTDTNTLQLGNASNLATLRCRVALSVTSDERDKTDIAEVGDGLEFINKLKAITYVDNQREKYIKPDDKLSKADRKNKQKYGICDYNRKDHAKGTLKGERRRIGLSAQGIQEALTSVYGSPDYANVVNDNLQDCKTVPKGIESKLTVSYEMLVPFLINAVQELSARVKELEGG